MKCVFLSKNRRNFGLKVSNKLGQVTRKSHVIVLTRNVNQTCNYLSEHFYIINECQITWTIIQIGSSLSVNTGRLSSGINLAFLYMVQWKNRQPCTQHPPMWLPDKKVYISASTKTCIWTHKEVRRH